MIGLTLSSFFKHLRKRTTFLIFSLFLISANYFFRDNLLFIDHSYIWDGAYRIYVGHQPGEDFITPVGYITFYLPALFFSIFGPSYTSLALAQAFTNFALSAAWYSLINKISSNNMLVVINTYVFVAMFAIPWAFPWYNNIAFLFGVLALRLSLEKETIFLISSGALCAASFFCKQDYGFIFLVSSVLLRIIYENSDNFLEKESIYSPIKKIVFGFIICFLIFFIIGAGTLNDMFTQGDLLHKFVSSINHRGNYVLGFFILILLFKNKSYKDDFLYFQFSILMLATSLILRNTSGLAFISSTYVVGIYAYFLYITVIELYPLNHITISKVLCALLCVLLLTKPLSNFYKLTYNITLNKVMSVNFENYNKDDLKEIQGIFVTKEVDLAILNLKNKFLKDRTEGKEPRLFNSSSLSLVYEIIGTDPPTGGLPLWFHEGVTFKDNNKKLIKDKLIASNYDYVILSYNNTFLRTLFSLDFCDMGGGRISTGSNLHDVFILKNCSTSN